jgi:uncharacterized protein (TIGR02996 family)
MTENDAFLADICEHPDDDAPRLVYADWLEEHGDQGRADFIRAQCADPRRVVDGDDPRTRPWAGKLARWCERWSFRRGFVEAIDVDARRFLARAEEVFRLAPVRFVRLEGLRSDDLAAIAALPSLGRLAVLEAPGNYRHAGCRKLFASPHLANLRGLAVQEAPFGAAGLAALLDALALTGLTHLDLGGTGVGDAGVELLSRSDKCDNLVALDLRGNGLTARAIRALDRSPHLGKLRRLGLWYNRLGDEGLAEFIRLPLFARLTHLSLGNNGFTAHGLRALAAAPALASVRTLWLGVDRYGAPGIVVLVRSPHLHREARLGIWLNHNLSERVKEEARGRFGDRVSFDDPGEAWEADPSVGWPLWQP